MVILLEEGTHSEDTNSSIKLIDQVSTRSRLIGIDSVLFLHFYGQRWSQGLWKRTKVNYYLLAVLTKHAWSITCLLGPGIIPSHPNKILAHDLIEHCIFYFFGIVQSCVSFDGVNVCWPFWGSQSSTFEAVSLILIFSHKFLVNKGTLFPVGNKTWQDKTNQLENTIHSILPSYSCTVLVLLL